MDKLNTFIHSVVAIWVVSTLGLLTNNGTTSILSYVTWCAWADIPIERGHRVKVPWSLR